MAKRKPAKEKPWRSARIPVAPPAKPHTSPRDYNRKDEQRVPLDEHEAED